METTMRYRYYILGRLLSLVYSLHLLSDKTFLTLMHRLRMGYWVDWDNPKNFSEKLQWLKLHDRRAEYTVLVDKVKVKDWVAEKIGAEYLIPTLGVWDSPEEVDFASLPSQFVIKCNHSSGDNYIHNDGSLPDCRKIVKILNRGYKRYGNYFYHNGEWAYRSVRKRILAEAFITNDGSNLSDYKFFCFNGEPKIVALHKDRFTNHVRTFYDSDWHKLPFRSKHPSSVTPDEKPKNFERMMELARRLSAGIPYVRVDLYNVDGKIYFGEMTLYPMGGFMPFEPAEWNRTLGDMIDLSSVK